MKEIIIDEKIAGGRLDKFLKKYLSKAPSSFIYKMLRKKNITLNKKKSDGSDILSSGDRIYLFLSEDTIDKFSESKKVIQNKNILDKYNVSIIFEDADLIISSKPSGLLSQKSSSSDVSINDILRTYVGEIDYGFKPSIINRLDRNTSGLLLFGKTNQGLRYYSDAIQQGKISKYYLALVRGHIRPQVIENYLSREEKNLKSLVSHKGQYAQLEIVSSLSRDNKTLAFIKLGTGRTHQIRVQLSNINHPLVGDKKYNEAEKNYGEYFLHAIRIDLQLLNQEQKSFVDSLSEKEIQYLLRYGFTMEDINQIIKE